MNWHLMWLWLWFFTGALMYWLKRAYFGVNPPNPVATGYAHYVERSWAPLIVRFFFDSMFFWGLFTPGMADRALAALGWTTWAWAVSVVTQVAFASALFGFFIDAIVDFGITKIPGIKDVLPQMPGPMAVNVNVTDQNIAQAKQNVDAAAENLKDVPKSIDGGH